MTLGHGVTGLLEPNGPAPRLPSPNRSAEPVELAGVTDLEYFDTQANDTHPADAAAPAAGDGRARRTPPVRSLVAVALLSVAAVAVGGSLALRPQLSSAQPTNDAPVVLPETLAGLPTSESQFTDGGGWANAMVEEFGGNAFGGRRYGVQRERPRVNLVVARTDGRGKADLSAAHSPYLEIGDVSCTRTFQWARIVSQSTTTPC